MLRKSAEMAPRIGGWLTHRWFWDYLGPEKSKALVFLRSGGEEKRKFCAVLADFRGALHGEVPRLVSPVWTLQVHLRFCCLGTDVLWQRLESFSADD